jgi:hypothetical protein
MDVEEYVQLGSMDRSRARNNEPVRNPVPTKAQQPASQNEERNEGEGSARSEPQPTPANLRGTLAGRRPGESSFEQADREAEEERQESREKRGARRGSQGSGGKDDGESGGGTREMGGAFGARENRRPGETQLEQVEREKQEVKERNQGGEGRARAGKEDPNAPDPKVSAGASLKTSTDVRQGDTSLFAKSFIPVFFTRADGEKDMIMYVDNSRVFFTRGGEPQKDNVGPLPADTDYYVSSTAPCPLGLFSKNVGNQENPNFQLWVKPGTVAGELPPGMDQFEGKNIANGGSGDVWAEVNVDQETGEVVSVAVDGGSDTPEDTDDAYYLTLGYYEFQGGDEPPKISNYGCGSVEARICRNWYAAESPYYGVSLSRCCSGYG